LNLKTGKAKSMTVSADVIYDVAVSPDGTEAALACSDNRVLTIDLRRFGVGQPTLRHRHTSDARVVAYSPDGSRLVSGGLDGVLVISSTGAERKTQTLQEHTAGIESLVFSPDGSQFASGSRDSKVRIHSLSGGYIRAYRGVGMESQDSGLERSPYIQALAWGEDDNGLVAGASNGRLYRLSLENDVWAPMGGAHECPIFSLTFFEDKLLVGGDSSVGTAGVRGD